MASLSLRRRRTAAHDQRDVDHLALGGHACNPNAVDPPSPEGKGGAGGQGLLDRLAKLFRRRKRPSAWSFTIPSDMLDTASDPGDRHRAGFEDPKLLSLAKALSRNC